MGKMVKILVAAIMALSLMTAGLTVNAAMNSHDHHAMAPTGTSCISYCLSIGHVPNAAPMVPAIILLFVAVHVIFAAFRGLGVGSSFSQTPAYARPAPSLISLYAHRLD